MKNGQNYVKSKCLTSPMLVEHCVQKYRRFQSPMTMKNPNLMKKVRKNCLYGDKFHKKNAKIKNIRQQQVKNVKISKVKSDHLKKNLSTKEVEKAQEIPLRRSKKLENESKIAKNKNKSVKLQSQIKSEPKLDLVLSRRPRGMRKNPKKKVPKDF